MSSHKVSLFSLNCQGKQRGDVGKAKHFCPANLKGVML